MNTLESLMIALRAGRVRVVDLTKPLGPETPIIRLPEVFAQSPGFTSETISDFDDRGPAWRWSVLHVGEHTGTHFDAPAHWITGRDLPDATIDEIPASKLLGPACVIDYSREAAENNDFLLSADHIRRWERKHGDIPEGAWLLLRTGWSNRTTPDAFLNPQSDGPHTPGFAVDAVQLLARRGDIVGVGVETVGADAGQASSFEPPFPAHAILLGAGCFGLSSLCNLDQLPPTGAIVIAGPLRIVNGTGSPCRVMALVEG